MSYRHEVLHLNSTRTYVRVGDTWYDTRNDFDHTIGEQFLIGAIEEILTYAEYKQRFPESKNEMWPKVNEKTNSGGYIRKATSKSDDAGNHIHLVEYAINPQQFTIEKATADLND